MDIETLSLIEHEDWSKIYMDCYFHGIYKASEISSETNIPIARIYELNRKLKRISGELE